MDKEEKSEKRTDEEIILSIMAKMTDKQKKMLVSLAKDILKYCK